jgi:hypothetical protein
MMKIVGIRLRISPGKRGKYYVLVSSKTNQDYAAGVCTP